MAPQKRNPPKGRQRLPGGQGRTPKQHKVDSFTADEKLKVLNHLKKCKNIKATINHFYPELPAIRYQSRRTLILSWRRKRSQIEDLHSQINGASKKQARPTGVGTILPANVETKLVKWVHELREEGVPVTATMLRTQALELAEKAKISPFTASWCWQKQFLMRNRFSLQGKGNTIQGASTRAPSDVHLEL